MRELGIKPEQINCLVDFYHAVEHLGAIAGQKSRWTSQERKTWVKRQRRRLLTGQTQKVLDEIETVCGPRCGGVFKRERGYFRRNIKAGRMDYHRLAEAKWPIGSGAIESAVRRVINLRLKGAGIFWHKKARKRCCCYGRTIRREDGRTLKIKWLRQFSKTPLKPTRSECSRRESLPYPFWGLR